MFQPFLKAKAAAYQLAVVDDEPDLLEVYCDAMQEAGYNCRGFLSSEALFTALWAGYRPDALLVDAILVGENGFDLIEEFQAQHPDVCIVMMSGESKVWDQLVERPLRVSILLEKPFDMNLLSQSIANLLNLREISKLGSEIQFHKLQKSLFEFHQQMSKKAPKLEYNSVSQHKSIGLREALLKKNIESSVARLNSALQQLQNIDQPLAAIVASEIKK